MLSVRAAASLSSGTMPAALKALSLRLAMRWVGDCRPDKSGFAITHRIVSSACRPRSGIGLAMTDHTGWYLRWIMKASSANGPFVLRQPKYPISSSKCPFLCPSGCVFDGAGYRTGCALPARYHWPLATDHWPLTLRLLRSAICDLRSTPSFQPVGKCQPLQSPEGIAFRIVTVGYGSFGEHIYLRL